MLDFIIKYWIEVLFGLICTGTTFLVKRYIDMSKRIREQKDKELIDTIKGKMDEQKTGMVQQMDECYNKLLNIVKESDERSHEEDVKIHQEIDIIKEGVLSVEGRAFRAECKKFLQDDHIITFDEYETILAEHTTYNKLGGNHEGDRLFAMVEAKYQNHLDNNGD